MSRLACWFMAGMLAVGFVSQYRSNCSADGPPPVLRGGDERADAQAERIDAAFNQQVFGGPGADAIAAAQARLGNVLRQKLASLDVVCQLADVQKNKLEMAGRGDVQRLLIRIETLRKRYQALFRDQDDVANLNRLDLETRREWDSIFSDPFAADSLFSKTQGKVLSAEQLATLGSFSRDGFDALNQGGGPNPRRIQIRAVMLVIDHRNRRQRQIGPANVAGVSIFAHDVEQSAEWKELRRQGLADVVSRPMIRTLDRQTATITIGRDLSRGGLHSQDRLAIFAAIQERDRVCMKIEIGIESGHRQPGAFFLEPTNRAIGNMEYSATCGPGEQAVLSGFWLPQSHVTIDEAMSDDRSRGPVSEDSRDPGCERELIVILSPEIVAD